MMKRHRTVAALVLLLACGSVRAQTFAQSMSDNAQEMSGGSDSSPNGTAGRTSYATNPFAGSVPAGPATSDEMGLSLRDATALALKHNLGLLLTDQGTRLAAAEWWKQRSALLPNVATKTSETVEQTNLQSFGFSSFPGVPSILGPFSVFDTRATASQPILDLQALGKTRAASAGKQAANFSYQDAREMVVYVVANLYYRTIAGAGRVNAARSQFDTAEALFHQAEDRKSAGTIPAIELLRAQVEMQAQQQRLIYLQNELEKERLDLARAIGLPDGQKFRLTDPLSETAPASMPLADALQQAVSSRKDLQSLQAQVRQAELEERAAKAERLPKLTAKADYGAIGLGPGVSHGTFSAAASLEFPLFEGGRIHGEVLKADAQLEQRRAEFENLRQHIEYALRVALLDIESARQQVAVAKSARELATEQMTQAQDRFSAGVADNIEVIQAQDALATANENYISSLFALNTASASLARAMGSGENGATVGASVGASGGASGAPQGESK